MAVETIGEAYMLGWRIHARCGWGRREAMKSVRGCLGKAELDLHTLVWTRGAAFPISQLDGSNSTHSRDHCRRSRWNALS